LNSVLCNANRMIHAISAPISVSGILFSKGMRHFTREHIVRINLWEA